MTITQHDPEWGAMTFDHGEWTLERQAFVGDYEVPIQVEPEAGSQDISPLQRQAVRDALALSPAALQASASAVVQNYEVYREMMGDAEMPPLSDPMDVWNEVTPSSIAVPPHADEGVNVPSFLLLAECSWDAEHGLTVRFRNGIADAADQQGELGLSD